MFSILLEFIMEFTNFMILICIMSQKEDFRNWVTLDFISDIFVFSYYMV